MTLQDVVAPAKPANAAIPVNVVASDFANAGAAAPLIAERPEARACYAQNWLRYLWGRADTDADLRTLTTIRQSLAQGDYGVRELLLDITSSAAFLHLQGPSAP